MTDVTTTPIAPGSVRLPRLSAPSLVIGGGIGQLLKACGRRFVDLSRAYADALELAYVKPARTSADRQRLTADVDLEGRDRSW
jgi:hypothetical protein